MANVLGKHAQKVGGQFDIFVSHFAEPWRVPSIVAMLKEHMSVRNVYVGEDSSIMVAQAGPSGVRFSIWPADEFDFPVTDPQPAAAIAFGGESKTE